MAAGNILSVLADREVNGTFKRRVSPSLRTRCIPLSSIMDREAKIAQGHVVLGFSGCGHYLISYCCEVSLAPPTTFYRYSLHWWLFDLYKKLHLAASYDLFRDEVISCELHLIVSQSLDQEHVIVLGCRGSRHKDDEQRACYVTILPRPSHPSRRMPIPTSSIHFKFDILSPFPSFVPSLSLRIPGVVLLNTVDSLVAVSYRFNSNHFKLSPVRYHTHTAPSHNPSTPVESVLSPSHVLQVEVYHEDVHLPMTSPAHHSPDSSGAMSVDQSSLDVELWINSFLETEMKKRGLDYRSLMDYDIQLYDVDEEKGNVKFVMIVLLDASHSAKSIVCSYTVELLGTWNVSERQCRAQLVGISELERSKPIVSINWQRTVSLALQLRKSCYLPRCLQHTIRAFSNHNVYTGGKSLQGLSHPYLPVQLVLTTNRRCHQVTHRTH